MVIECDIRYDNLPWLKSWPESSYRRAWY